MRSGLEKPIFEAFSDDNLIKMESGEDWAYSIQLGEQVNTGRGSLLNNQVQNPVQL